MEFIALKIVGSILVILAGWGIYKRFKDKATTETTIDDLLGLAKSAQTQLEAFAETKVKEIEAYVVQTNTYQSLKTKAEADLATAKAKIEQIKAIF